MWNYYFRLVPSNCETYRLENQYMPRLCHPPIYTSKWVSRAIISLLMGSFFYPLERKDTLTEAMAYPQMVIALIQSKFLALVGIYQSLEPNMRILMSFPVCIFGEH